MAKKAVIIFIVLVVLVLLAAGGGGAYYYFEVRNNSNSSAPSSGGAAGGMFGPPAPGHNSSNSANSSGSSKPSTGPASSNGAPAPYGCEVCKGNDGMFICKNGLPINAKGVKVPAGTPILISNYRNSSDSKTPSYTINGGEYWYRENYVGTQCGMLPVGCKACPGQRAGMYGCPNGLPTPSKPTKKGNIVPANSAVTISNYREPATDSETPNYVINGNKYWFRQGGSC